MAAECAPPLLALAFFTPQTAQAWKPPKLSKAPCNNRTFGDPAPGTRKACFLIVAPPQPAQKCANENGVCKVGRKSRHVYYGAKDRWNRKSFKRKVKCTNSTFGDAAPGTVKSCRG